MVFDPSWWSKNLWKCRGLWGRCIFIPERNNISVPWTQKVFQLRLVLLGLPSSAFLWGVCGCSGLVHQFSTGLGIATSFSSTVVFFVLWVFGLLSRSLLVSPNLLLFWSLLVLLFDPNLQALSAISGFMWRRFGCLCLMLRQCTGGGVYMRFGLYAQTLCILACTWGNYTSCLLSVRKLN